MVPCPLFGHANATPLIKRYNNLNVGKVHRKSHSADTKGNTKVESDIQDIYNFTERTFEHPGQLLRRGIELPADIQYKFPFQFK